MNRRKIGTQYEEMALEAMKAKGFLLLERNFRCRLGEIDLIGIHGNCLTFVEVKYRSSTRSGYPEEAVDGRKQERICRASDYYRLSHRQYQRMQVRYDVVAVLAEEVRWYQNAFGYRKGRGAWN